MREDDARRIATAWLASAAFEVRMKTGRTAERPRSWIFEVVAVNGEPLFGNAPLVVDKASAAVTPCKDAWRELVPVLGPIDRLKRWWSRGRRY